MASHVIKLGLFLVLCAFVLPYGSGAEDDGSAATTVTASIETVTTDQFHSLVRQNNYVVLLLTKTGSEKSAKFERELLKIQQEIQSHVQIIFLKMENSIHFAKEFGLTSIPALLFLRKTKPIIYEGDVADNEIHDWLENNLQSSLQNLDDDSFEHLTQAATGATTGDWFVMFCNMSIYACRSLETPWETVAAQLKGRLNVALVDTQMAPKLIERFRITETPSIKLFHLGKMYQYSFNKYDVSSLTRFALGWYKNIKHDSVPAEKTPFDNLIDQIVKTIKKEFEDPYAVPSIVMLLLPFSIVVAAIVAIGRDYKLKLP